MIHFGQAILQAGLFRTQSPVLKLNALTDFHLTAFYLDLEVGELGGSTIVDIKVDGVTIFPDPATRPRIIGAGTTGHVTGLNVAINRGQWIAVDVVSLPPTGVHTALAFTFVFEDGAGAAVRGTVATTTAVLASGAEATPLIRLGKGYVGYSVDTSHAIRLRLYTTAAARTADQARAYATPVPVDSGCTFDRQLGAGVNLLSPLAFGANLESIPTDDIPALIENRSGGAAAITVAITRAFIEGAGGTLFSETPPNITLLVREADGTPSLSDVTELVLTNATLTDLGGGSVQIDTGAGGGGSSLIVEELDGTPSVTTTKIIVANGDLIDNGGGEVRLKTAGDITLPRGGYYSPFLPPTAPSAYDDEYNSVSGLWTPYQAGDSVQSIADSLLKIVQTSQSGYKLSGIFQALPVGNWAIVTRLALISVLANYVEGGLALFEDATNNPNTCKVATFSLYNNGSGSGNRSSAGEEWTNHTTYSSALSAYDSSVIASQAETGFTWLKIVKTGSNYDMSLSTDTGAVLWKARRSGTISFTPVEVGLFLYNNGTGASATLLVDCFRLFATDPLYIGGVA